MKLAGMFFWKRLDRPGLDSCRLFRLATGWRLSGAAVFRELGLPCHFDYEVTADLAWRTRSAKVTGYLGRKPLDLRIRSARAGRWQVNGKARRGLTDCIDLDLGFTPATNLIPLRRLALRIGEQAEAPAAYIRFPQMTLVRLPQTYRRTGRTKYWYESPTADYSGTLRVLPSGAVRDYPGMFELVTSG